MRHIPNAWTGFFFLPLEGKVAEERSDEDGWGEALIQEAQSVAGFSASPAPSSLALGHPALEGGEVSEEGSVGVLLLAVAVVTMVVSFAVVAAGQFMIGFAAAEAAADAAALAAAPVTFRPFGATGTPVEEAGLFARANGAVLVGCRCPVDESWEPRTVAVTVRRSLTVLLFGERSIEATSWAEFIPTRLLDPVTGHRSPVTGER